MGVGKIVQSTSWRVTQDYKNFAGDVAITLVCTGVQGAFADEGHPYASHGPWLQVFVGEEFFGPFLADLEKALGSKKVCDAYLCYRCVLSGCAH